MTRREKTRDVLKGSTFTLITKTFLIKTFLIKTINNKTFITNTFLNQDLHNQDFPKSKLPNRFTKDHVCHHKIGLIRKDPRFVCETYKTGETMNGLPYLAMSLTK